MRIRTMDPFSRPPASLPEIPGPRPLPVEHHPSAPQANSGLLGILKGFQTDDYILLGMIAVLFFEGCEDYTLMAALGYLFFMGIL